MVQSYFIYVPGRLPIRERNFVDLVDRDAISNIIWVPRENENYTLYMSRHSLFVEHQLNEVKFHCAIRFNSQ
jgi:hypothetical protein